MQDQRNRPRRGALRTLTAIALMAASPAPSPANAATRGYTITSFDAIRVDAPVMVILTTGTGASARAEGDQGLLDRLTVNVSGRLLSIGLIRPRPGEKSGGAATLRLSTGDLNRVVLTGGGSVTINRMKGLRGDIVLGGNGDVTVAAVDLDRIDVALAGGGRATLNGRAGVANIRVNGPGAVAAAGLRARQATVGNDGPGSIAMAAEVTAKIVSTGSGDVTVTGAAACTVDNRGTGRIACGGEDY